MNCPVCRRKSKIKIFSSFKCQNCESVLKLRPAPRLILIVSSINGFIFLVVVFRAVKFYQENDLSIDVSQFIVYVLTIWSFFSISLISLMSGKDQLTVVESVLNEKEN